MRDISDTMRRVKSTDTAPEMHLRRALWRRGLRYRLHQRNLPGNPDIVFASSRVCVFVDGDFWHGNQWRRRGLSDLSDQFGSSANRDYWIRKIHRNVVRDRRVTAELVERGWTVVRLWESDVSTDIERCVSVVTEAILQSQPTPADLLPYRTAAEFFGGIGLMRMGLERAGWSVVYANDIDPEKRAMYCDQFGPSPHYALGDVHDVDPASLPDMTLATASFPCNDLSLAGARRGLAGSQSSAYWGFVRALAGMRRHPPLVLLENVPGFLSSHGGSDFEKALRALGDLGYAVDAFVLDAASFVPQSRRRLFVVGALRPLVCRTQSADTSESALRPRDLCRFMRQHPDLPWHHRALPSPPDAGPALTSVVEDLPEGAPEWWSRQRVEYLLNQMSPRHRAMADSMIAGPRWSFGTVFRRMRSGRSMAELRTDGIAGCLRTPRGGSARQILLQAGGGECRARFVTPREAARLMGADDYRIEVPLNQALFGFGDAVCVPVIAWIAEHYLNPLADQMLRGVPLRPILGEDR